MNQTESPSSASQITTPQSSAPANPRAIKGRRLRRTLYALLFTSIVLLCLPMIVSAANALQTGDVYDPFTGERFEMSGNIKKMCVIEGGRLLDAVEQKSITGSEFDERMESLIECRTLHPRLYSTLKETRNSIGS